MLDFGSLAMMTFELSVILKMFSWYCVEAVFVSIWQSWIVLLCEGEFRSLLFIKFSSIWIGQSVGNF